MLRFLMTIWNNVFALRDWQPHGDAATGTWVMRRWDGGQWETRDCTAEEAIEASWWQANR